MRHLLRELVCFVLGHDYFVLVYDEEHHPRRKCSRCGVWAVAKGWRV